jgi:hypothetical protein
MKNHLLFYIFFAGLFVVIPTQAYSEKLDYVLQGFGYGVLENTVAKISIQANLTQAEKNKPITFQNGHTVISGSIHPIIELKVTFPQNQRSIKLVAMTDDDISINIAGRLVASNQHDSIFAVRGNIEEDNSSDKIYYLLSLKQVIKSQTEKTEKTGHDVLIEKQVMPRQKKELTMEVNHNFRNYWNENYKVFVKVFDKSINPRPNFDDYFGTLDGVQINVTLANLDGTSKYAFGGVTKNNGYWEGSQYLPENISRPGKYNVTVVATRGDDVTSKSFTMFLFGIAANRVTITNGTAP